MQPAGLSSVVMPELPENFLTDMCNAQDRTPEKSRLSEDTDYVHVSALSGFCARQYALARRHQSVIRESPYGTLRIIWKMGLALEEHVIQSLKRYYGEHAVLAKTKVRDEEYAVSGRPDTVIMVSPQVGVTVEIKSMNAADYQKLERPLGEHVFQAIFYRWLLSRNPLVLEDGTPSPVVPHRKAIILYVAKDAVRGSPYKEYQVDVDSHTSMTALDVALEGAAEYKRAREANRVPARHDRICPTQDCTRARNCPVAAACWNIAKEGT